MEHFTNKARINSMLAQEVKKVKKEISTLENKKDAEISYLKHDLEKMRRNVRFQTIMGDLNYARENLDGFLYSESTDTEKQILEFVC
jgi:hypothetical protein